MQDIELTCKQCGRRFAVLGILAEDEAICPGCAARCSVPATSEPPGPPSRKETAAPTPTARQSPPSRAPKPAAPAPAGGKRLPLVVGVSVIAALALGAAWLFTRSPAEPTALPLRTPTPPHVEPPSLPTDPRPDPAPRITDASPVPAEPAPESPERAEMRRIAMLMLEQYPFARPGAAVVLTLQNGMVYEGELVSVDERFVHLLRDGDPVQIAVNTLDMRSRARVDNEYRFEVIKNLVRISLARRTQNP